MPKMHCKPRRTSTATCSSMISAHMSIHTFWSIRAAGSGLIRSRQPRCLVPCASAKSRQLVAQLPRCQTVAILKRSVAQTRGNLDAASAAAALVHLAKLQPAQDTASLAALLASTLLKSTHKSSARVTVRLPLKHASAASSRQLANCCWALGQLQLQHLPQMQQLLEAIEGSLLQDGAAKLRQMNMIEVCNVMVGLAKLRRCQLQLLQPAAAHAVHLLQKQREQHGVDVCQQQAEGVAAAGEGSGKAAATPAPAARVATPPSPKEIAGIFWAAATLRFYDVQLCDMLAEALVQQLHACSHRDLSTSLWGLATLGHTSSCCSSSLFIAAAQQLQQRSCKGLACVNIRDVVSYAWSFSMAAAMLDAQLCEETKTSQHGLIIADQAASLCSQTMTAFADAAAALVQVAAGLPHESLAHQARQQLFQCILTFDLLGVPLLNTSGLPHAPSNAVGSRAPSPGSQAAEHVQALVACCRDAWVRQSNACSKATQSALHKQVYLVLLGLGLNACCEAPVADGLMHVDILIPAPASPPASPPSAAGSIAVEVDGPSHFSSNQVGPSTWHVLGTTRVRCQLLRRLGLRPVQLAHQRWDQLQTDRARMELLQELLGLG